jgi:hypothetical protein
MIKYYQLQRYEEFSKLPNISVFIFRQDRPQASSPVNRHADFGQRYSTCTVEKKRIDFFERFISVSLLPHNISAILLPSSSFP